MSHWAKRLTENEDRKRVLWGQLLRGRQAGEAVTLAMDLEAPLADALRMTPMRAQRWAARIGDEWVAQPLAIEGREFKTYTLTEVIEALTRLEEAPDPGRPWRLDDIREVLRAVRAELIAVIHPRAGVGRQIAATTAPHPGETDRIAEERARNAEHARHWAAKIEAQIKGATAGAAMPRPSRIDLGSPDKLRRPSRHDINDAEQAKARLRAQVERLRSEGFEETR